MSECRQIREQLNDWLDEVLEPDRHEQVEAHLRACSDCRVAFQRYRALNDDLLSLGGAADRIAAAPHSRKAAKRGWMSLLRIAAVITLMVIAGWATTRYWLGRENRPLARDGSQDAAQPKQPEFYLASSNSQMAVRMESSNPRIHIVWLYGTMQSPPPEGENGDEPGEPDN